MEGLLRCVNVILRKDRLQTKYLFYMDHRVKTPGDNGLTAELDDRELKLGKDE